jgi:hypothetical protein
VFKKQLCYYLFSILLQSPLQNEQFFKTFELP